jgi:BirA family biotin operon repressor/biotin-[acetyl-CoA-carboxylase] ligase
MQPEYLLPIQTFEYHEEISSTHDRVRELLAQPVKPPLPCLVVAKRQTAGRGRGNKRWWSGEGALLMSFGFELSPDTLTRDQLPTLSIAIAQSVASVLRLYLPMHTLEVHPPNDVFADGKKICGILLESPTPLLGIIGIGLNVNNRLSDVPADFIADLTSRPITSMIELLGKETDISCLIKEILEGMSIVLRPKFML